MNPTASSWEPNSHFDVSSDPQGNPEALPFFKGDRSSNMQAGLSALMLYVCLLRRGNGAFHRDLALSKEREAAHETLLVKGPKARAHSKHQIAAILDEFAEQLAGLPLRKCVEHALTEDLLASSPLKLPPA